MKKNFFYWMLIALMLGACAKNGGDQGNDNLTNAFLNEMAKEMDAAESEEMSGEGTNAMILPASLEEPGSASSIPKAQRKVIYSGSMSLQVKDLDETHKKVVAKVDDMKGYISEDVVDNSYGYQNNRMTIRVPKEQFYPMVSWLEENALYVESKQLNANDVTEEFVDLSARLKNEKEAEETYREILKSAKSISEVLEVQRYINNIREEIEATEGRLKYLSDQTSYSTLTLSFYEDKEVMHGRPKSFGEKVAERLGYGWEGLLNFILGILTVWPLWLFLAAFGFGLRFLIKRLMRKSKAKSA